MPFKGNFFRKNNGEYAYIQVTYSMTGNEKVKEREYRPFREIRDGYPRYIISLDIFRDQQEGFTILMQ